MKSLFKTFAFIHLLILMFVYIFVPPMFAGTPLVAGHALTTGQIIVGVTGGAPVANTLTGTANQITATQGAEGGNFAFSFPNSVIFPGNVQVLGTLTPTSTSYTYDDLTVNNGINTSTMVITDTGASALDVAGGINAGTGNVGIVDATGKIPAISSTYIANLSGANLTALTAANISAGSLGSSVVASSWSASAGITAASLASSAGVTAATTVTGGTGLIATAGPVTLYSRTLAEVSDITPTAKGQMYFVTDAATPSVAVSTGVEMGNFGLLTIGDMQ